jgi:hypothetical protein
LVPARPVRRFHALRVLSDRTSGRPKPSGAPLALSRPSRGPSQQSRTGPQRLSAPARCFLSSAFWPYGTLSERRVRCMWAAPPGTTPYRVRGLATPLAAPPSLLPAREAPEHPWASPFKVSLVCGGDPLEPPALLTFLGGAPPFGRRHRSSAFRASFSPRAWDPALSSRNPHPSWGSPLQSSTRPSGPSLVVARPTSTPSGGVTLNSRLGPEALRIRRLG